MIAGMLFKLNSYVYSGILFVVFDTKSWYMFTVVYFFFLNSSENDR
jgi:hypothetical protein